VVQYYGLAHRQLLPSGFLMRPLLNGGTLGGRMSSHEHGFPSGGWPFEDPQDVAAISCRHILDGRPILRVTHDDDGSWQLLCGEPHVSEDAKVVCLGCMVRREPTLLELADLPLGWCADRDSVASGWERSQNS
jgi:hypothetical protein